MPYVSQVVQGRLPYVNIYGGDYDTVDGTGTNNTVMLLRLYISLTFVSDTRVFTIN